MNWEAIGAMGEILGAVAVLVTLVYLAQQIRQNTRQMREGAAQASLKEFADWRKSLIENRDVAEFAVKAQEGLKALDYADRLRYREFINGLLAAIWAIAGRIRDGSLDFSESDVEIWLDDLVSSQGARDVWKHLKTNFSADFQIRVKESIQRCESAETMIGTESSKPGLA